MDTQTTVKRKPLIIATSPTYWGREICPYCDKKIIAYNHERHRKSLAHKKNRDNHPTIMITSDWE